MGTVTFKVTFRIIGAYFTMDYNKHQKIVHIQVCLIRTCFSLDVNNAEDVVTVRRLHGTLSNKAFTIKSPTSDRLTVNHMYIVSMTTGKNKNSLYLSNLGNKMDIINAHWGFHGNKECFWHFHETAMTSLQVDYICISESSRSMCAVAWMLPWKMGEDDVIMGSPPSGELSSIRSSGFTVLADAVLLLQQIETTTFLREVYKPAHLTPQQCYGTQRETVPFSIFALELCLHVTFFSQSSLFRPFKNVLNVFLWCCSHMALNYAKRMKFTADENGRKNITCKRTFKHRYEHLFSQTVDGRICSH